MTRFRSLPTALVAVALLGAGAVGAQTIISGTNSVHVTQSPAGSVVTSGNTVVTRSLFPMPRPALTYGHIRHVEPVASRSLFSFPQMFLFFGPWTSDEPRVVPVDPDLTPRRGIDRMHAEPENRAADMMQTILRRMDL
ncbi:MAG: hypothetical protein ACK4GT_10470 [Pararhodobacter sp.]